MFTDNAGNNADCSITESDLLSRARGFDQEALAHIYRTYQQALYRYVYHHIGDEQTAQDLTAEVFGRFLQALRSGRGPDQHLKSWLYRVAHNLIVDELRRRTHRNHQSLDDAPAEVLHDGEQSPDERAWTAIAGAQVREALAELSPDQRQIVILKFLEGLDNSEIAEITGKTVGAVKALQHRALESLRARMSRDSRRTNALRHAVALGPC